MSTAPFNAWVNKGVVVAPISSDSPEQPNVLYEGNSQMGNQGNVFKMWFSAGTLPSSPALCYAESTDGINWTRYSGNPLFPAWSPRIFKHNGTYYCYSNPSFFPGGGRIDVHTSADGVHWTLAKTGAITDANNPWASGGTEALAVVTVDANGKWWGYYSANPIGFDNTFLPGLATSTDGINWTVDPNNPVIALGGPTKSSGNFTFKQINGIFYGWSQIALANYPSETPGAPTAFPSDISRFSAPMPGGPWTWFGSVVYYRTAAIEGVSFSANNTQGQVADPTILEVNGSTYLYYTSDGGGVNYTISCAVAPMTLAQLVQTYEGVQDVPIPRNTSLNLNLLASDNFHRANANPIGGSWTPVVAANKAQLLANAATSSVAGTRGDSYWNGLAWDADQWSQIVVGPMVTGSFAGAAVRQGAAGLNSEYVFAWGGTTGSSGTYFLQKFVNGTFTQLGTGTLTVNVGDTLTLCAIGNTVLAYYNGFLLEIVSDSGISSGSAGFMVDAVTSVNNAAITAWTGGNFKGAPSLLRAAGGAAFVEFVSTVWLPPATPPARPQRIGNPANNMILRAPQRRWNFFKG